MIVVAIVAILAAIGYPSYMDKVRRGHRAAAQEHLLDLAQRQQQFFLDNRNYAPDLVTLNMVTPVEVANHYNIAIALAAGPPPTFLITATAIGPQAPDGNLTIDNTGNKAPANKW